MKQKKMRSRKIGNEFALELTKLSVFKTEPPSVNPAPIIW